MPSAKQKREARDKAIRNEGFTMGIICALAVVRGYDNPTMWKEIIRTAGPQEVLQHAMVNEGDWDWGGFERYAVPELGREEVDKARRAIADKLGQQIDKGMGDGASASTAPSSELRPL